MANVALPIKNSNDVSMNTTLPIFEGEAVSRVRPVSIDNLINAEKDSLSGEEKAFQKNNGTNAIPSSFDSAERICNILRNPPAAGQVSPEYEAAVSEYIGLLTIFACRSLLGLNISKREIDMSENASSPLLKGLGNQLTKHGGNRTLTYFTMDNKAFAYLYDNCIIPIKDKELYKSALLSVPFYNGEEGQFEDILSASGSDSDVNSGKLLFKQLLYGFLLDQYGAFNGNSNFLRKLGAPYLYVTDRIQNVCRGTVYLPFIEVAPPAGNLFDVLMNAPVCPILPQSLFSDNLLLLHQNNNYKPPCFGEVVFDDERYNVVNPISKELCQKISEPDSMIRLDDPDGAPDCSGSTPDEDGCITCRVRLTIGGVRITVPRKYSVYENCKRNNRNGELLESINMGIDCNVNPCATIPSIFRRYIVWNGPECVSVSFAQPLSTFPVTHLGDKATVAIVAPDTYMPKFAYLDHYGTYCGCIKFPAPLDPVYIQIDKPTSIYLDFGTTNSICLVEHGGTHTYVDIKEYVKMVTGENAEFRIFHMLSDRDNNDTVRSMAVCSVKPNTFGSPLYRAHAMNAGKNAIEFSVKEIIRQKNANGAGSIRDVALDLTSVNVYDNLKWTDNELANEGYRAVVGSIFSSAFAKLLQLGYDPKYATISISVPSSMDKEEIGLTNTRVEEALTGIRANKGIQNQYYESTAAAFYIIRDPSRASGNFLNVGVDIGGGSIDLFSFESKVGNKNVPIPACIDSVKNAAGRRILSETFAKAAKYYYQRKHDPNPDSNPFFTCFDTKSAPPASLNTASESAALCITETYISEAKFNENSLGPTKKILNTFRRNVLFKTLAVLNYAAEFAKASWQKDNNGNEMDFSNKKVNIILCGNGSGVYTPTWAGIDKSDEKRITDFLKERIGCQSLNIERSANPKKETVTGMKHIEHAPAEVTDGLNENSFVMLHDKATLCGDDTETAQKYVTDLMTQIKDKKLLHVSGDVDPLDSFHRILDQKVNENSVITALAYVLDNDDTDNKGNGILLADVFLRVALELPFMDPNI